MILSNLSLVPIGTIVTENGSHAHMVNGIGSPLFINIPFISSAFSLSFSLVGVLVSNLCNGAGLERGMEI